ncbi:DUF1801 domain-containing protein [Algoriphagus sp.]|uniref:DUF1801 domain-containing protein n=1 Tax=Algoriphagus sp. TaxID=1872435 RepID=UPI0025EBEECB|nr:DUF1801 domain-containing protein [Algoriphagus sp.]
MTELKTRPNNLSVIDFLNKIESPERQKDGFKLLEIFTEETNESPVLWGPSIIGFGQFQYKYKSGREELWFPVGFSPRKQALSIYLMKSFSEFEDSLSNLGKHKISKGCLYIKRLTEVNESVLRQMIRKCYTDIMGKDQK